MSFDTVREMAMSFISGPNEDHFTLFGSSSANSFRKRDTYYKVVPIEISRIKKNYGESCTGSSYIGEWHTLGFCGQGTYCYPHGVEYSGHFNNNGQFHGLGTLYYPNGQQVRGIWKNGKLFEHAYVFDCGDEIDENFTYCRMPDRRYFVEKRNFFGPTGLEYLTEEYPATDIPKNHYDVACGIYDPKRRVIFSRVINQELPKYHVAPQVESCRRELSDEYMANGRMILEIPTPKMINWIKANCRKAWDEPTGVRPDLFENWNAGRRKEMIINNFEKPRVSPPMIKESQNFVSFIRKIKKPTSEGSSVVGRLSVRVPGSFHPKLDSYAYTGAWLQLTRPPANSTDAGK